MPNRRNFSDQFKDPPPDPETFTESSEHEQHRLIEVHEDPHQRLDYYLKTHFPNLSRSKLQKLINSGDVTLNGKSPKASAVVKGGDKIQINVPPPEILTIQPEEIPIDILYEDEHLIVVNKQKNLVVHPARSHTDGTLLNGLAHYFRHAEANGIQALAHVGMDTFRPGIVHRLDKDTTGVMVLAKTENTHYKVSQQFEHRKTQKYYLAVVHGELGPPGAVIDQPIGKHPQIPEAMGVRRDAFGKDSVTIYRVREVYNGYSLVEVELKTGRTHQIRVHLMYEGFPIAGDVIYGASYVGEPELHNPPMDLPGMQTNITYARTKEEGLKIYEAADLRDDLIMERPALHAARLELTHPVTEEPLIFNAPIHDDMRALITRLRTDHPDHKVPKNPGWVLDVEHLMTAPRDLRVR